MALEMIEPSDHKNVLSSCRSIVSFSSPNSVSTPMGMFSDSTLSSYLKFDPSRNSGMKAAAGFCPRGPFLSSKKPPPHRPLLEPPTAHHHQSVAASVAC